MAELKGMREALEVIRQLPDHVAHRGGGPIRRGLRKAARLWKEQAEENASGLGPGVHNHGRVSYRLKDSIMIATDPDPESQGFHERVMVSYNRKKAWWGAFAEEGTEKQDPQPFLRPALDQVGDRPIGVFADSVGGDIRRIVKRLRK